MSDEEKRFSVKELVEAIGAMNHVEARVVAAILNGKVDLYTVDYDRFTRGIFEEPSTLMRAIANWDVQFPAHKDDAILLLLEELLEDRLCQQQNEPGKAAETLTPS